MPRYSTKMKPKPRRKRSLLPLWLALTGFGLILVAVWAFLGNNSPVKNNITIKGEPRLKVQAEIIDHGDVRLGTPIRDDIRITNIGDQPLRFARSPYVVIEEGC